MLALIELRIDSPVWRATEAEAFDLLASRSYSTKADKSSLGMGRSA